MRGGSVFVVGVGARVVVVGRVEVEAVVVVVTRVCADKGVRIVTSVHICRA